MPDWYVATPMLPAAGKCEVIIYSAEHGGSLGTLPDERLALLVDVWIDRYRALRGKNGIKYVMPFENRGEEAGVTLHHPHGQIYAFNTVPPLAERFAASFSHFSVNDLLAKHRGTYKVFGDDLMTAFVPPFARYSYEIWIVANRAIPGPWAFTAEEKNSFALMLKNTVRLYDKFYGRIAPYLYTMHAAPLDQDDTFEFTSQFYPLLRTPQKLKFLGGVEQGTGLFLNDVLPEDAVSQLRAVASALGL